MKYSEEQLQVIEYLLRVLKFDVYDEDFIRKYSEKLDKNSNRYKKLADTEKEDIEYKGEKKQIPANGFTFLYYRDNGDYFENITLSIFQFLKLEIEIKKNQLYQKLDQNLYANKISATDISNFTYCPVSYAISKSFKLKSLEETQTGSQLHDRSILRNLIAIPENIYSSSPNKKIYFNLEESSEFQELKSKLKNCEILYYSDKNSKIFESKKGNYFGKPDYILINRTNKKVFVIEEKYQYQDCESQDQYTNFHQNHIQQLLSYVLGIEEYNISFGILIYWKYDIDYQKNKFIHKCSYKEIKPDKNSRKDLNNTYSKIKLFKESRKLNFNPSNRNPVKCASCVNNIICGHKTGKFTLITLPYKESFLKINPEKKLKFSDFDSLEHLSHKEQLIHNLEEAKYLFDSYDDFSIDEDIEEKELPSTDDI